MFKYYVYGHKLLSNVQLHMLTPYTHQSAICDVKFIVKVDNICDSIGERPITTVIKENEAILRISDKVAYHIDCIHNLIEVKTIDLVWMESTFLNLPFALFFAMKGMVLLHASSLIDKTGNVIPICAPKGTGKTTLSLGLSKYFNFYSDDAVMVCLKDGRLQCFAGTNWVKLNADSFKLLGVEQEFDSLRKNVQGKGYYNLQGKSNAVQGFINKLFFLNRISDGEKVDEITRSFTRKISLHKNICGTSTLGYEYCKMVEKNNVFKYIMENVKFIKISICDDMKLFESTVQNVKNLIENTIEQGGSLSEC